MKKQVIGLSLLASSLLFSGANAFAAGGYVTDSQGAAVRSSSGACWRTGYWTPSMATAECDPELAQAPKAPAPVAKAATPAPAKQETKTLTLSSDGLFAFGQAKLLPKGKAKLNEFAAKVQGQSYDQIVIEGYTDRLGSAALNQRLSQQRADAVKAYLVGKKLNAAQIEASGKGSANPVTTANQCPGKGGAKVKACLAPDRRVEIKVVGLK